MALWTVWRGGSADTGTRGRCPPVLGDETRWAIEHLRKYSEPGKESAEPEAWMVLDSRVAQDSLFFM